MTNTHHIKKENEETKVDEIILQAEKAEQDEKKHLVENSASGKSIKEIGEKISLGLILVLLLVSIIQSYELFNLRSQILKGQFSAVEAAAPATGSNNALPGQQGGC